MEPRITIVTLGVSDLERSVRFYRDGLGLPQAESPEDIAFFDMGGTRLALYPAGCPHPGSSPCPPSASPS